MESAFQRLAAELSKLSQVEPVRLQDDSTFVSGERTIDGSALELEVAWANNEVFSGGMARDFMVACLKSTTLRWMQSGAAGFDHPVFAKLVDNGVMLSNSHATAVPIAEFVLAALLDHFNPQAPRRELQQEGRWGRVRFREVSGSTWLIVGMGHIGSEVATRARAFGATVVGVRRSPRGDEPADRMITPDQIAAELPSADVVLLALPANAQSEHMVDAAFLGAMAPRSALVNVGRGSLVDEAALLAALDVGTPACAILDVFETEPLPADSPLWKHPSVHLSAHDAPNSDGLTARNDRVLLDNLARYVVGERPQGVVDASAVKG